MRLLFQHGGQTGVTRIEHLADALTSRPHMNSGDLFVDHDNGQGRILLKIDSDLTALVESQDPEILAQRLWQEAQDTTPTNPKEHAMNEQLDRLDQHAQALKDGTRDASEFGAMSTGEKLYIALAASSFELLEDTGYSIASALDRLGPDWCRELIARWR